MQRKKSLKNPHEYFKKAKEIEDVAPWRFIKKSQQKRDREFFEQHTEHATTRDGVSHALVGVTHLTVPLMSWMRGWTYPKDYINARAGQELSGEKPKRIGFERIIPASKDAQDARFLRAVYGVSRKNQLKHLRELLKAGVPVLSLDVVGRGSQRTQLKNIDQPHMQRAIYDFRNLLWAEKLDHLGEPTIYVCGKSHLEPVETSVRSRREFHTLQRYLADPDLRKRRWEEYARRPEYLAVLNRHFDLKPSMDIREFVPTPGETPDLDATRKIGSIAELPHVKAFLEKALPNRTTQ